MLCACYAIGVHSGVITVIQHVNTAVTYTVSVVSVCVRVHMPSRLKKKKKDLSYVGDSKSRYFIH